MHYPSFTNTNCGRHKESQSEDDSGNGELLVLEKARETKGTRPKAIIVGT